MNFEFTQRKYSQGYTQKVSCFRHSTNADILHSNKSQRHFITRENSLVPPVIEAGNEKVGHSL